MDEIVSQLEQAVTAIEAELIRMARGIQDTLRSEPQATDSTAVDLGLFDGMLPPNIQSARIHVSRPPSEQPIERHPNSDQYARVIFGRCDIQTLEDDVWITHLQYADEPDMRWQVIPRGMWHRPMPVDQIGWAVIVFHTAPPHEIIDEYPTDELDL